MVDTKLHLLNEGELLLLTSFIKVYLHNHKRFNPALFIQLLVFYAPKTLHYDVETFWKTPELTERLLRP